MSPALSTRFKRISRVLSIQTARSLHFLVLVWFLGFIVAHVTLALTTGALANLNHIYAAQDGSSWTGFWIFAASMVVVIVGWVAATPSPCDIRVVQRVGYALISSSSTSPSCGRCPTTNRSPSTSASRGGRASPSGAGCRCRRSSTS